jgi:hypothetical protein
MNRTIVKTIALQSFALAVMLGAAWLAQAHDAKALYSSMAPLEQYLMPRVAEIALTRSAAPAAISRDATVLVVGRKGYETAVKGENGSYVSWKDRGGPISTTPSFGTPKFAVCYNPSAARSVFPARAKRQERILAGLSKTQVFGKVSRPHFARKELPTPNLVQCAT